MTKNLRWRRAVGALMLLLMSTGGSAFFAQDKPSAKQNARDGVAVVAEGLQPASHDAAASASVPIAYSYEFTQPEFFIRRIIIEHDERGRGKITFERKNELAALTEPIELSEVALGRIASHWDALRFLESQDSYQASKQFPHLGTMRLKMQRGTAERTAEFNWTSNRSVSSLVDEYRRIGEQAIFIFDIKLAREMQPLEAPKIMSRLEMLLSRNGISDSRQILPLLEDLATDERIPLIARNQADRLVKKIKKSKT